MARNSSDQPETTVQELTASQELLVIEIHFVATNSYLSRIVCKAVLHVIMMWNLRSQMHIHTCPYNIAVLYKKKM
jgi:hypothetical protein